MAQTIRAILLASAMGDDAVILSGVDSEVSKASLYSTVHGAGRVMSRTEARGKWRVVSNAPIRALHALAAPGIAHRAALGELDVARSALARSFETNPNFIKLGSGRPRLGCMVTMWRGSKASGQGHVFFYTGEDPKKGVYGIAGNENDSVGFSFHERSRITGYWWPKAIPVPPESGPVRVNASGATASKEV
jgi:tRNA-splicing ligase RtcB